MAEKTRYKTAFMAQRFRIYNMHKPICLHIKTKHDEEYKDSNITAH